MKRQLKTLKGKRVVLTNNANEITRNEIGIIEKQDGTLEVKEHDANGNIENIAGGSSTGDIKEYYYSIDPNKMIEVLGDDLTGLNMMLGFFNRLIKGVVFNTDTGKLKYIDYQHYGSFTNVNTVKEIRGGRIIDSYPITIEKHQNNNVVYCDVYGDYYNRCVEMFTGFDEGVTPEHIKEMTSSFITEITKEEYKALIEVPNVIIGK